MNKFYITTPIYYVNDKPHIGHAYTTIAADVLARYYAREIGEKKVFFLTGTDEHGEKIAEAAGLVNKTPKEFCDSLVPKFQEAWKNLNIKNDYFIRTTNKKHEKIVQELLTKIRKKGDIYKAEYEGLYCVGCEKYLTKSECVDGKCPLHPNKKLTKQKEENYFFKLSKYQDKLLKALEKGEYQVLPKSRHNEVVSKIKAGLEDVSISRQEVSWGIPVPWDSKQTIYVWFDALLNYYSGQQIAQKKLENKKLTWFPPDVHLMAKEILWFHAVIWPAMLMSLGLPLPKKIFAHGFFTVNGQKMSKSLGNAIDPNELIKKYNIDVIRYYLLTAFPFGTDGDVSYADLERKNNNELANSLGNLVSRVSHLCEKNNISQPLNTNITEKKLKLNYKKISDHIDNFEFDRAIAEIFRTIEEANRYIEQEKPWELKEDKAKLKHILVNLVLAIREIAKELSPIIPATAEKIEKGFASKKIKKIPPLFVKITNKK